MNKSKEIVISVGLLESDMKTKVNKARALKTICSSLKKCGIKGFNVNKVNEVIGYWESKPEPCVQAKFINIDNVSVKDILKACKKIRIDLKQEAVLVQEREVDYMFV